jgi:enoyl-CoA hydratase
MDILLLEIDDAVATVTLNRPEKRNALNSALLAKLRQTLESLDQDEQVGAIVLTGADPAFCAGLDMAELGETGENMINAGEQSGLGPIPPLATPLIAAVNGPAITGGLELALLCDIVIASENARFADTHARIGLLPDWGSTALLPQAVGIRKATEMLLSSNFIDPEEAHRCGLVNEVTPHDQLLEKARGLARDIASNDRGATAELLSILKLTRVKSVEEGIAIEAQRSLAWQGSGIDTGKVSRLRDTVINRGRKQL